MNYLTVGQAADRMGVKPRTLTAMFYDRVLDADRCPVVRGRRMIPVDYLESIAIELRRAGRLPALKGVTA